MQLCDGAQTAVLERLSQEWVCHSQRAALPCHAVGLQGCGQGCRHGSTWKWEVSGVIDGPLHIVA